MSNLGELLFKVKYKWKKFKRKSGAGLRKEMEDYYVRN